MAVFSVPRRRVRTSSQTGSSFASFTAAACAMALRRACDEGVAGLGERPGAARLAGHQAAVLQQDQVAPALGERDAELLGQPLGAGAAELQQQGEHDARGVVRGVGGGRGARRRRPAREGRA